jgi:hypothetical protein
MRAFALFFHLLPLLLLATAGCRRSSAVSAEAARRHVLELSEAALADLGEVRRGLPAGTEYLREYFAAGSFEDATRAKDVLERTRAKVQDLRVAKPTFFALVDLGGVALRSDRSPDLIAGKSLFAPFPELRAALAGKYVETRGAMDEASGVRGKKDGQWVAAAPVVVDGAVKGIYAAGWSWSSYAYRLETKLRSELRAARKDNEHEALVYVYVLVEKDFFGAPVSPEVNARALAGQNLLGKTPGTETSSVELEITGRQFGAAFKRTPELGKDVGIVVMRSET